MGEVINLKLIKSDGQKCDLNCPYLFFSRDCREENHRCNMFGVDLESFKGCYRCKQCMKKFAYRFNS